MHTIAQSSWHLVVAVVVVADLKYKIWFVRNFWNEDFAKYHYKQVTNLNFTVHADLQMDGPVLFLSYHFVLLEL